MLSVSRVFLWGSAALLSYSASALRGADPQEVELPENFSSDLASPDATPSAAGPSASQPIEVPVTEISDIVIPRSSSEPTAATASFSGSRTAPASSTYRRNWNGEPELNQNLLAEEQQAVGAPQQRQVELVLDDRSHEVADERSGTYIAQEGTEPEGGLDLGASDNEGGHLHGAPENNPRNQNPGFFPNAAGQPTSFAPFGATAAMHYSTPRQYGVYGAGLHFRGSTSRPIPEDGSSPAYSRLAPAHPSAGSNMNMMNSSYIPPQFVASTTGMSMLLPSGVSPPGLTDFNSDFLLSGDDKMRVSGPVSLPGVPGPAYMVHPAPIYQTLLKGIMIAAAWFGSLGAALMWNNAHHDQLQPMHVDLGKGGVAPVQNLFATPAQQQWFSVNAGSEGSGFLAPVAKLNEHFNLAMDCGGSVHQFLNCFVEFLDDDPTHGYVDYAEGWKRRDELITVLPPRHIPEVAGPQRNRISIAFATGQPTPKGRPGIRLASKLEFGPGSLFVVDVERMPVGDGTWPAYWTTIKGGVYGSGWPAGGEIDMMEHIQGWGLEEMRSTLHTKAGCTVPDILHTPQGSIQNPAASCEGNNGCMFKADHVPSGHKFNKDKGGIHVMMWDDRPGKEAIRMWWFPRKMVEGWTEDEKASGKRWENILLEDAGVTPYVSFPLGIHCPASNYWAPQTFIINTALCGDWAGNAFGPPGGPYGPQGCKKVVSDPSYGVNWGNNTAEDKDGDAELSREFIFNSVRVFSKNGLGKTWA